MNKDYDNVIRIATSLDFHDDADPNASCLVYYYKAQAYVKLENYPMAKEAFFRELELRKKVAISLAMTGIKKESISSKSNSA